MDARGAEYKPFDPNRFRAIFLRIGSRFRKVKTVQVIGTNGKGSTSTFLSQMLTSANLKVGLFTSPHIFRFNERIVFDGKNISDEELRSEHESLHGLLSDDERDSISYFEYCALIAYSFLSKRSDIVVLEAGLGGEFDATTVFDKDLMLVTEIDEDHKEFLGDDLEEIAGTKLRAMNAETIVGSFKGTVYRVASQIALQRGYSVSSPMQVLTASEIDLAYAYARKKRWPRFQAQNLLLAMAGAKKLGIKIGKDTLPQHMPKGRFEQIAPNIIVDVGHNPACAKAIAKAIPKKTKPVLVFNTLREKEYEKSLAILAPKIKRVEIIGIDSQRAIAKEMLCDALNELGIEYRDFDGVDGRENYLVFGSFLTACEFARSMS